MSLLYVMWIMEIVYCYKEAYVLTLWKNLIPKGVLFFMNPHRVNYSNIYKYKNRIDQNIEFQKKKEVHYTNINSKWIENIHEQKHSTYPHTFLRKLENLASLKIFGRTLSSKALASWMMKECPSSAHEMMDWNSLHSSKRYISCDECMGCVCVCSVCVVCMSEKERRDWG